jgi:demethylmenaquinone methyltransferase / 2-methoxy-6-polyprenyl-1,4-benzoquinol methylase
MASTVTPYKSNAGKKEQVATMFNNIAPRYDFLNQLLSLGIHKGWRKKTINLISVNKPKAILDIATGTADFAIEANRIKPKSIIGIDISEGMLQLGVAKIKKLNLQNTIQLQLADSENLPFANNSFDAITVGFGVRNFEHLEKGISEMYRVLAKGGIVGVLEFSNPRKFPIKQLYNFYFNYVTPAVGKFFSKDASAYSYLPESVKVFPDGEKFLEILHKVGFTDCKAMPVSFGIATIYTAKK